MFNLKILLRNAAKILNYEIKKLPPNRNINVYLDQQALLGNQKVDIIFDVGANIGSTTREYLRLFPHSSIYCFEPFKEPFLILLESFKNFNSVKPFKLAVTDLVGKKPFFVNKANVTNSLLPPACEYEKYQSPDMMSTLNTISVETTTIDYFCNKQFIDNIQILKMDIQGGELMALQGAKNMLESASIDVIYTEVLFAKIYEGQATFYTIGEFLEQYGYILYGLYHLSYANNGVVLFGDAIFISPSIEMKLNTK